MSNETVEPKPDEQSLIEATFRNGSITAIGVVVGFSLGFLSRWSALPGQWAHSDLVSVVMIALGLGLQIKSLADLLLITSLQIKRYNRSIRIFLADLILVGAGIVLAIFADHFGLGGIVLQGRPDQSKTGFALRPFLISARRPFASSLRFLEARVGRVGRRGFGRSVASRTSSTRRATASSRLRS